MPKDKLKKVRLLKRKMLVERQELEENFSGIIIPETAKKKEVGFGFILDTNGNKDFNKNDKIIFNKYSGYDVDDNHVALDVRDVIALYE